MSTQMSVLLPNTFEQMMKYAEMVSKSDLVPKDYQGKPHNCLIAMQWATELGLHPLQGLQNIAVINGRPSLWGDMLPALVKNHPSYVWMKETIEKTADGALVKAVCSGLRKGHTEPESREFSVLDAQKANLWGKSGPWAQYPQRMLQMRARAWLCRDLWPDALRGLSVAEEAQDIEATWAPAEHDSPPVAVIADERKQRHDAAVEQYLPSLEAIRAALTVYHDSGVEDALYTAAEAWAEIPQAAQMDLWLATTKGGWFTTAERKTIKEMPKEPNNATP